MQTLRSGFFFVFMVLSAIVIAIPAVLTYPFAFEKRYAFIRLFARFNLWSLKLFCNLTFNIKGAENIPKQASIILCKHQSTWETFALQLVFPPQIWVLKKALLNIPFFGWGLAMLDPIAINRSDKRKAIQQLIEQGKQRLESGRWVVLFPEGTRMAPGVTTKFMSGGARLAERSGRLIVPVAHNAGEFWPKHGFTKLSGTITISILPSIDPKGLSAAQINRAAQEAVEQEMLVISTLNKNEDVQR